MKRRHWRCIGKRSSRMTVVCVAFGSLPNDTGQTRRKWRKLKWHTRKNENHNNKIVVGKHRTESNFDSDRHFFHLLALGECWIRFNMKIVSLIIAVVCIWKLCFPVRKCTAHTRTGIVLPVLAALPLLHLGFRDTLFFSVFLMCVVSD